MLIKDQISIYKLNIQDSYNKQIWKKINLCTYYLNTYNICNEYKDNKYIKINL